MTPSPPPHCLELDRVGDAPVGGKAEGLARLLALGFDVPPGFVVVGASPGSLPADLRARYQALGEGPVAVRSSALGEDSADASFAGQYETVLGVQGYDALVAAIERCLASTEGARAVAYRSAKSDGEPVRMSVVVQRMVDARAAGVLFTVDPVSGRRDRVVVDAVEGLGEALVSGHADPDHYLLDRSGRVQKRDLVGDAPILSDTELRALCEAALHAEAAHGAPLDTEWAIDREGAIRWLQARPVTHLPADPRELDTPVDPADMFTRCNIGEMMPGAVTPLTFSLTGRGIDVGMQRMFVACGIQDEVVAEDRFVGMFFGHLFLNLSYLAETARCIAGSQVEQLTLAVCGRLVPELTVDERAPVVRRLVNGVRYGRYMLSSKRARSEFEAMVATLVIPDGETARAQYEAIDRNVGAIWDAYDLHMRGSTGSGALAPILALLLADGEEPTAEHHAEVARLLAGATDVESADIAAGADRILDRLMDLPDAEAAFAAAPTEGALAWLRSRASGEAGAELARYLARHGHRAVRELELRQKEWAADPLPLVASLQAGYRARRSARGVGHARAHEAPRRAENLPLRLRKLVALAQEGVRAREHTKSLLVKTTVRFKVAYRRLGALLAAEGLLADDDAVYFLTHAELGALVRGEGEGLAAKALARRAILPSQMPLVFEDVFRGAPEPLELHVDADGHLLKGKPVSRGVVRGRARVVLTLSEAEQLEEGEILIAPITDVGWTPYFALIAGLATDIGSAVSHGAVVAREYGLPAVVSLGAATSVFRTGDEVVLDGDRGILKLATDG